MGTAMITTSEQLLHVVTPVNDTAALTGQIPARSGMVIVIDWINGWCTNPALGGPYGSTITMRITTDQGIDMCMAYDDGFATGASAVRSVFKGYWGGVPMAASGTPGIPRVGQAADISVDIDGASNNGAGSLNQMGASVGYHYELG